jgi:hypothetical protein
LKEQRFNVTYDEMSMRIVDLTGGASGKLGDKAKL